MQPPAPAQCRRRRCRCCCKGATRAVSCGVKSAARGSRRERSRWSSTGCSMPTAGRRCTDTARVFGLGRRGRLLAKPHRHPGPQGPNAALARGALAVGRTELVIDRAFTHMMWRRILTARRIRTPIVREEAERTGRAIRSRQTTPHVARARDGVATAFQEAACQSFGARAGVPTRERTPGVVSACHVNALPREARPTIGARTVLAKYVAAARKGSEPHHAEERNSYDWPRPHASSLFRPIASRKRDASP